MLEALSRSLFDRDVARIDRRVAARRGWTINEAAYPVLDVTFQSGNAASFRVRLSCPHWDELPPSIALLAENGTFLAQVPVNSGGVFHPGPHPQTSRPFVCMRGSLEYHTHPQHVPDGWANYRAKPGMDLGGIVFQLWRVWKRSLK